MKELIERLQNRLVTHLWDIEHELEEHNGFSCPQQVDDIRDCVSAIKDMRELLSSPTLR